MKIIDTFFILYPQKNKQAAGHPQGKTDYINEGLSNMSGEIPPGDGNIIPDHELKLNGSKAWIPFQSNSDE